MRLPPQGLVYRGPLRDGTPVRAPSDPSSPAKRAEQARELTLGKALTAQRRPTAGQGARRPAAGPVQRAPSDEVESQDTHSRPYGQEQRRECLGLFDRAQQLWHAGVIVTSAVAEASIGNTAPVRSL